MDYLYIQDLQGREFVSVQGYIMPDWVLSLWYAMA